MKRAFGSLPASGLPAFPRQNQNRDRLAGSLLMSCGLGLILIALDGEVAAVICERRDPVFPARCIAAHQVPPQEFESDREFGCVSRFGLCIPAEGTVRGNHEGYATPAAGRCQFTMSYGGVQGCIENATSKVVMLEYHRSFCAWSNGRCRCFWMIGEQPPRFVEMCDCAQTQE